MSGHTRRIGKRENFSEYFGSVNLISASLTSHPRLRKTSPAAASTLCACPGYEQYSSKTRGGRAPPPALVVSVMAPPSPNVTHLLLLVTRRARLRRPCDHHYP